MFWSDALSNELFDTLLLRLAKASQVWLTRSLGRALINSDQAQSMLFGDFNPRLEPYKL